MTTRHVEATIAAVNPGPQAGISAEQRRVGAAVNRNEGRAVNPGPQAGRSGDKVRLPSPWGEHGWKVYLFDFDEIEHAVEYVNGNPTAARLPAQGWPWVKPFEK